VADEVIRAYGGEPVGVYAGFAGADAVLLITDHPDYRRLDLEHLMNGGRTRLVYDSWRILDESTVLRNGARYAGIGYEPVGSR
jgi:UDP-N-acetyl-D-mannosaminuronic acid dehydrogenase